MFATDEFIRASRKFVCIRIETYENKKSEAMVRQLLGGRFENTAFAIFSPDGSQQLSRSGRSPGQGLADRRGPGGSTVSNSDIVSKMNRIAQRYRPTGLAEPAELQDFNSLRQALNVASADQRLLVFVVPTKDSSFDVTNSIKSVFADEEIVGKFHLNFADPQVDKNWAEVIRGETSKYGIMIVRSSQFGLDGEVFDQLNLDANDDQIKTALLKANEKFAGVEQRKDYQTHVRQGRRERIYFENEIPYGEDRDGDGKADQRGGGRRGR